MTPLQMAEVAATVANKGELMEPRLWSKVIDPDGRETKLDPAHQSRVMSEDTASELNTMMQSVVQEGTGTAAAPSPASTSPARPGPRRSRRGSTTPGSSASPRRTTRRSRSPASSSTPAASAARPAGRSSSRSPRRSSQGRLRWLSPSKGTMVDERYRAGAQDRLGRDGRRLARGGHRARPQRGDQDPPRPLRAGQRVRPALPARGSGGGRASSTRTWSGSSTAAPSTTPTSSRWSTSTGRRQGPGQGLRS